MEDRLLYKIYIKGRVQGVGFRWSAVREAKSRDITGFVKNLSDGSVYIEAEGSKNNLLSYLNWCKMGPDFGFVESVKAEIFSPVNYKEFMIKY